MIKSLVLAAALCAVSTSATLAADEFRVYNYSSNTIEHVYVLYDDGSQSADLLGDTTVLRPDHYVDVLSDGESGCMAHVEVDGEDGDMADFLHVNTCENIAVEVYDSSWPNDE